MRVLIAGGGTGGHLMPALAIAHELTLQRPDVEPVLVGAKRGIEAALLPTRPYRHYLLSAEPVYRHKWWRNIRWPMVLWRLLKECHEVLVKEQPAIAVGTGGYASAPILIASRWRGIPTAVQEQNAYPGLTTRLLSRRARQVHLGFPEANAFLKVGKNTRVFEHGNPIVPPPPALNRGAARRKLGVPENAPVVLVVGGSTGGKGLNRAVAEAIDAGALANIALLWSTGRAHWENYQRYARPPLVQARAFWDPIGEAYEAADLVVARAGAMTLAELCAYALPSVLVPLPTAAGDHQTGNAKALENAGAAIHLPEPQLTGDALSARIRTLFSTPDQLAKMGSEALRRARPNAVRDIVSNILTLAGS